MTALIVVNLLWGLTFPIARGLNLEIQEHFEPSSVVVSSPLLIQSAAWIIFMRFAVATGSVADFLQTSRRVGSLAAFDDRRLAVDLRQRDRIVAGIPCIEGGVKLARENIFRQKPKIR